MFLDNFDVLMSKIIFKKLKKILITTRKKSTNSLHRKKLSATRGQAARIAKIKWRGEQCFVLFTHTQMHCGPKQCFFFFCTDMLFVFFG